MRELKSSTPARWVCSLRGGWRVLRLTTRRRRVAFALAGLGLALGGGVCLAADPWVRPPHGIMRPDRETRLKLHQAFHAAPEAPLAPPAPAPTGSLTLFSNLTYIPSQYSQGACGDCWCWAGHGCLEILLNTQNGFASRLSVQYMNSCEFAAIGMTCCSGGWIGDLANFYSTPGYQQTVPYSNPGANWQDGGASCATPCGSITTSPCYPVQSIANYSIATFGVGQTQAVANIKALLNQNKPVTLAFWLPTANDWATFDNFWDYQSEDTTICLDYASGQTWTNGGGHEVLCVGYNDNDPANPYWILVNSWGTTPSRPNGIFHLAMTNNYNSAYYDSAGAGLYQNYYWQYLTVTYNATPFSSISASPPTAKPGTPVTITFTAWTPLAAKPTVMVNTNAATYVTNAGTNYTYAYIIQPSDANGAASLAIRGMDAGGNSGFLTNTTALIVDKAPATITVQPNSQAAAVGANVIFQVTAAGTAPLAYQWGFNGTNLPGAVSSTLTLTNVLGAQGGPYAVLVTNAYGSILSSNAVLTVLDPCIVGQPANQSVTMGAPATFTVSAMGTPPLSYQWRFNGTNLPGAVNSTLALTNALGAEAGPYAVLVTNACGSALSSNAVLTVLLDPSIVGQPANQSVTAGAPATFTVSAMGTSPLSYQWFQNGTALVDGANIRGSQTPTLTVAQVLFPNLGQYLGGREQRLWAGAQLQRDALRELSAVRVDAARQPDGYGGFRRLLHGRGDWPRPDDQSMAAGRNEPGEQGQNQRRHQRHPGGVQRAGDRDRQLLGGGDECLRQCDQLQRAAVALALGGLGLGRVRSSGHPPGFDQRRGPGRRPVP